MSDLTISGKIIAAFPARSGISKTSGKSWVLQQFIIETMDQYPKKCLFEVFGEDKLREFNLKVGDVADVSFDIDAREYQGKWFNSIRAWRVTRPTEQPVQQTSYQQPVQQPQQQVNFGSPQGIDSLPF